MARLADVQLTASGLYAFLERQERAVFERWCAAQDRRAANGYPRGVFPRQRRWDAFAAGLPVNVESGEIWGYGALRDGAPVVARPAAVGRLGCRVIVTPSDTVTVGDDGVQLWIEENDL